METTKKQAIIKLRIKRSTVIFLKIMFMPRKQTNSKLNMLLRFFFFLKDNFFNIIYEKVVPSV